MRPPSLTINPSPSRSTSSCSVGLTMPASSAEATHTKKCHLSFSLQIVIDLSLLNDVLGRVGGGPFVRKLFSGGLQSQAPMAEID